MAELARIARPWLFSLRPPMRAPTATPTSIYLGLGYSRSMSATTARHALPSIAQEKRKNARSERQKAKEIEVQALNSFLLPYTIVPPPLRRYPKSPTKFAKMVWLILKNRSTTLRSLVGLYFVSMPSKRLGWPRFRTGKKSCIPTAKALHVQMSEAVAVGDKETLRRICSPQLFQTLAGAIDSRPAGTRTEWELVRYDNKMRYPRIADFRAAYQPANANKQTRIHKQAVVSISSVQRLTRYDETGIPVPGSERERHMTEHLVLHAFVSEETWETSPWQIWGTLSEMSYERIRDDDVLFSEAMESHGRGRK